MMAFEIPPAHLAYGFGKLGKKSPVDNRDALAGDEKEDEEHGKDGTKCENNDNYLEYLVIYNSSSDRRSLHVILPYTSTPIRRMINLPMRFMMVVTMKSTSPSSIKLAR